MRVDDIWPETGRSDDCLQPEQRIATLAAATPIQDGKLELVAAGTQRLLQLEDEDAEIGVLGARVHLRHEEDPHY